MAYFYGKGTVIPPSNLSATNPNQQTTSPPITTATDEEKRERRERCRREHGRDAAGYDECMRGYEDVDKGSCVQNKQCLADADCGEGGKCIDPGKQDPVTKKFLPGRCSCNGVPPTPTPSGNCPEGVGKAYEGCGCGEEYPTKTGKCVAGYVYERHPVGEKGEGTIGLCVCQKALDEWKAKHKGDLGEYKYPSGMSELMALLLGRGKELMGMPLGFSQEAQNALFGRGFENVRAQQRPAQEQLTEGLSRQGMLGTGTALGRQSDLAWNSENAITDLARQLFVANEEKKKADLLGYTGAASDLLGRGMGYEQLLEAVNSGRRGEANQALMLLLQILSQFGG